jgi:hypothetical protein
MQDITTRPAGRAIAYLQAMVATEGSREKAAAWVAGRGFRHGDQVVDVLRAPVGDSSVADYTPNAIGSDLAAAARPLSVAGRLRAMGYLRNLPLRSRLIASGVGATASFVRGGHGIPASRTDWASPEILAPGKVATIAAFPRETIEHPELSDAARVDLIRATAAAEDHAMLDVANTGSAGAPASITSAGALIASAGSTVAALDKDMAAAVAALVAGGSTLEHAVWVASPAVATLLAGLRGTGGANAYPNVSVRSDGALMGLPIIASGSVDAHSLVLLDAQQIAYGDSGDAQVSLARQATLEMSDSPVADTLTPTGSVERVGLFQADAVALRVIRRVAWLPRRDTVSAVIAGIGA